MKSDKEVRGGVRRRMFRKFEEFEEFVEEEFVEEEFVEGGS